MNNSLVRSLFRQTCAGLALSLSLASPSFARDNAGAERAQRARVAYDLRDWASAAREFRAAYDNDPKGEYLFGLAQALRQSRDYAGAIFTFKAYKRLDGVTPQQATAAELLITQCEAEQTKSQAEASLREARSQPPQPAANAQAAPAPVQAQPFTDSPPAPIPPEPRAPAERPFYTDVLGDSLFVVGLGAAAVGTVMLLGGNSDMRESASAPTESGASDAADEAHGKQVLGAVLLPVGATLIAGAVWRWMSIGPESPAPLEGLSVGAGYVSYGGQF